MQLLSLKYQQEAGKGEDADSAKIEDLQKQYSALYEEIMKTRIWRLIRRPLLKWRKWLSISAR